MVKYLKELFDKCVNNLCNNYEIEVNYKAGEDDYDYVDVFDDSNSDYSTMDVYTFIYTYQDYIEFSKIFSEAEISVFGLNFGITI